MATTLLSFRRASFRRAWHRRTFSALLCIGAGLFALSVPADAIPDHPAQAVVRGATNAVRAEAIASVSPKRLCELLNDSIAPHFDLTTMSRRVLGTHWEAADSGQRAVFSELLRSYLTDSYAAVLEEQLGKEIDYLPTRTKHRPERAMVRTQVAQRGGLRTAVNYAMHRQQNAWKVYDVAANGVSLVALYRSSFSYELRKSGLVGLIGALQQRQGGPAYHCTAEIVSLGTKVSELR